MSTIHKYRLSPSSDVQEIKAPPGSTIISALPDDYGAAVYVMVPDPNTSPLWETTKKILVIGTGWDFTIDRERDLRFIATVRKGTYVWHVLEVVERRESE